MVRNNSSNSTFPKVESASPDTKKRLLSFEADELLEMFGQGKPTPGSGSACALQALLSAKLIRTVIILTSKKKFTPIYDEWLPELERLKLEIENQVYPKLKDLMQEDSDEFDEYIRLFKEREKETNKQRIKQLDSLVLKQLSVVSESALAIAKYGVVLGKTANYVFRHGFKDARGDSSAALNSAIATVAGCHAIIELNLGSFERNDWTDRIRDELKLLTSAYADLLQQSAQCIHLLENEGLAKHKQSFDAAVAKTRSGTWEEVVRSEAAIERVTKEVQNILWRYRDLIWKDETPGSYLDVLKPEIAIRTLMGYDFRIAPLGLHITKDGVEVATAGEIDKKKKIILVSSEMNSPIQSFTAAHELGHALLHKSEVLHRDRALDGSYVDKDIREWQADKFATFFLMPAKLVIGVFQEVFTMEQFVINQDTVFAFSQGRVSDFRAKVKDLRGLAFFLANYRESKFRSMSEIFQVSPLAMARRLEELALVKF